MILRRIFSAQKFISRSKSDCLPLRFIQFRGKNNSNIRLGVVSDDGEHFADLSSQCLFPHSLKQFISSPQWLEEYDSVSCQLNIQSINDDIVLLPPILCPKKIIAVDQVDEIPEHFNVCRKEHNPDLPVFVNKLPSALTGPTSNIVLPRGISEIKCRAQLGVVIGREAFQINARDAFKYIFGYTVTQQIKAVKFENNATDWSKQSLINESSDTFCPIGPTIVHRSLVSDPHDLTVTCAINTELVQCDDTRGMKFRIEFIMEYLTKFISLSPGDIILMGKHERSETYRHECGRAKRGDVIESEIRLIGGLQNFVK